MRRSRSKSFSDSLVLADMDQGGVIVQSIRTGSPNGVGLREGDEIIGASICFDKLNKDEVLRLLRLIEPYDKNMKVLTKENMKASVSSGSLNNYIPSPKEMLDASNRRLFQSKVQRFLNREPLVCAAPKTSDDTIGDLNSQLQGKGVPVHLDEPSFKSEISGPDQNLFSMIEQTPQIDINAKRSGSKIEDSKPPEDSSFNLPDFRRSHPMPPVGLSSKLDEPDDLEDNVKSLEVNLSGLNSKSSDMDLNLKIDSIKEGDSVSGIDMLDNSTHYPELDLKSTSMKLPTLPKFVMAGPNVKGPEMETPGPDLDIDASLETPDLNLKSPQIEGGIKAPEVASPLPIADMRGTEVDVSDVDLKSPSLEVKLPTLPQCGISGPDLKHPEIDIHGDLETPDMDFSLPTIKEETNLPELEVNPPSADFNIPKLDMKTPDLDISPSGKFTMPNLKSPFPKFKFPAFPTCGISGPKLKCPEADIDADLKTPDINLSAPAINGEINAPELAMDLPKSDLNSPKLGAPHLANIGPSGKFTMPKFSLSGPKLKGPEFGIDTDLITPDLNLKAPKLKGGIKDPDMGLNLPSADLKGPEFNVDVPNINQKSPFPKLKFPKLPKLGFSGPKVNCPEVDIDADPEMPDFNPSIPNIKGLISTPDLGVDLPKADLNSPKFTMPKWNLSGPKVKGPDFGVNAGLRTPDLNLKSRKIKGGIKAPDIDVDLPNADLKGTEFNVDVPNINQKSPFPKLKFPTWPKLGFSGPKVNCPDVDVDGDLETPDFNLSAPNIKGQMSAPDLGVDLPNADLNSPELDLKPSDLGVGASSVKFTMPKFDLSGPKVKGPDFDINAGLKTPDLNLKSPMIKGGINAPDLGSTLPRADIKGTEFNVGVPNINLKSPSQKCKFPKFPKFGISGPKMKHPDMDIRGELETPDMNVSPPTIKGEMSLPELEVNPPNADFNIPKLDMKAPDLDISAPSGKFTMPKFSLSGPRVKGPDFGTDTSLKTPDLNLKAPKLKGGIKAPDMGLSLPSADQFNVDVPNINLKSPSQKFKFPTLPKLGISGPNVNCPDVHVDGDVETPDFNLSAPNIKGKMSAPGLGVDLPKADLNSPKFTMPKLNLSGPKVKGPDFDMNVSLKNPDLNLKPHKIQGGIKAPDIGLNLPSEDTKGSKLLMKIPDVDLKPPSFLSKFPTLPKFGISGPKLKSSEVDIDADLKTPDINFSAPNFKGEMNAPELAMDLPKYDLNSPKLGAPHLANIDPSGKFTMPKFSLSGPKVKGPDFGTDTSLKTPVLNLKAPKLKGGIKAPNMDLNLPSASLKDTEFNVDVPNINLKSPSQKFKFPTLPKLGISGPNVNCPDVDVDGALETPDFNLSAPNIKGKISTPDLGVDLPKTDLKSPKFTMPKLNLSGPKVKGPDFGINAGLRTPDLNLKSPKIKGGIKAPDIDLDLPSADIKGTELNVGKFPTLNFPNFGISGHKSKHPEMGIHGDLKMPDMNVSPPTIKGEMNPPNADFNIPKLDMKTRDLNLKAPKLRGIKAPNMRLSLPSAGLKDTEFNVDVPNVNLKSPSQKLKFPTFPKFGISKPKLNCPELDIDGDLKTPDFNLSASNIKGQISAPDLGVDLPKTDLNRSKVDMKISDLGVAASSVKFTKPKCNLSGPKVKVPDFDIDAGLRTHDLNLKSPKLKGGIKAPDLDLDLISTDIKNTELNMGVPDIDQKSPSRKFKSATLPNLGISGPKVKCPEMDIGEDLETTDLNLSAPQKKRKTNAPKFQNIASEFGADLPEADLNIPMRGMKMPDLDIDAYLKKAITPKFSAAAPSQKGQVKRPYLDIDTSTYDVNLTAPKIKESIETPEVDIALPNGDMNGHTLDLKASNSDSISHMIIDEISSPDVIQSLPQTNIRESLNLKTSNFDLDAPSGELKVPTLKRPKNEPSELHMSRQLLDIDAVCKEAHRSASKKKKAKNTAQVDLCLHKNDMSPQVSLQASSNDAIVHSGIIIVPTAEELKSASSELSIKEQDLHTETKTQNAFPSTSNIKAGFKTSDKSPKANLKGQVNTAKPNKKNSSLVEGAHLPKRNGHNSSVSTNIMRVPDIDFEVPGGTLKRSKMKLLESSI